MLSKSEKKPLNDWSRETVTDLSKEKANSYNHLLMQWSDHAISYLADKLSVQILNNYNQRNPM